MVLIVLMHRPKHHDTGFLRKIVLIHFMKKIMVMNAHNQWVKTPQ